METGRIPEGTKENKPRTAAEIIAESREAQQETAVEAKPAEQPEAMNNPTEQAEEKTEEVTEA